MPLHIGLENKSSQGLFMFLACVCEQPSLTRRRLTTCCKTAPAEALAAAFCSKHCRTASQGCPELWVLLAEAGLALGKTGMSDRHCLCCRQGKAARSPGLDSSSIPRHSGRCAHTASGDGKPLAPQLKPALRGENIEDQHCYWLRTGSRRSSNGGWMFAKCVVDSATQLT